MADLSSSATVPMCSSSSGPVFRSRALAVVAECCAHALMLLLLMKWDVLVRCQLAPATPLYHISHSNQPCKTSSCRQLLAQVTRLSAATDQLRLGFEMKSLPAIHVEHLVSVCCIPAEWPVGSDTCEVPPEHHPVIHGELVADPNDVWCCACTVCASSQAFAIKGGSLANGGIFGFPYAILPTNDGASVLVADSQGNRVTRYSARDLSYEGQWTGLNTISGLAQAMAQTATCTWLAMQTVPSESWRTPRATSCERPTSAYLPATGCRQCREAVGSELQRLQHRGVLKCWDPASSFTVLETFQAPDAVNGRFSPIGVAIDPRTGNVLASDYDNGRVVAFSSDGTFLREVITGFPAYTTAGLAVDAAGNIYLPIYDEIGGLFKYDSNGKLLAKYGGALRYPWAVSVGADGVVWVTEEINGARKITCM